MISGYTKILYEQKLSERSHNEDRHLTARDMFDPNDYYDGCVEFLPNGDMVGFRD